MVTPHSSLNEKVSRVPFGSLDLTVSLLVSDRVRCFDPQPVASMSFGTRKESGRPTVEVLVMELTGVGQGEASIKRGCTGCHSNPSKHAEERVWPETQRRRWVSAAAGMSGWSLIPPHRAWARPQPKTALPLRAPQDEDSLEHVDLPGVGFPFPSHSTRPPRRNLKCPQRAKRDLIYKLFFFPKNTLSRTFFKV